MLKIGLDIDEVIADFINTYLSRFGTPKNDFEITKNVNRILSKDRDFWLNLPKIRDIDFIPELYCTKRVNPKAWTKQWLSDNGFYNSPVYQMYYQKGNKATMIKGRCDVFIDDSISNFIKMNMSGIPCLLMDTPFNQNFGPVLRVYSLDKYEIEEAYNLGLEQGLFKHFKQYFE